MSTTVRLALASLVVAGGMAWLLLSPPPKPPPEPSERAEVAAPAPAPTPPAGTAGTAGTSAPAQPTSPPSGLASVTAAPLSRTRTSSGFLAASAFAGTTLTNSLSKWLDCPASVSRH